MPLCECGCGGEVERGQFLSGHDQRLRVSIEQRVGGLLPLRALVESAEAYAFGSYTEAELLRNVRAAFAGCRSAQSEISGTATTCRDAILECAKSVMRQSGLDHFTIPEIIDCMAKRGSRYAEATIRTHVTSRMCLNAPDHHAVTFPDLERTERGTYRLVRTK
jgi:hypothetical protein